MRHVDVPGHHRRSQGASCPTCAGRLAANAPLADITWFRVGGPAQVLFTPADEADLAYFLKHVPDDVPVTVIGLGSNLLVRDGGVPGVVIRLGRGFGEIKVEAGHRLRAGTAVPDVKVARAAAEAGIAGLAFYRGIPGSIGGALRMNAGAHGRETKDVLVERARRRSRRATFTCSRSPTWASPTATAACRRTGSSPKRVFQGAPGDPAEILQGDGRGRRLPREEPADQGAHRRLDVQEPAGQQRLEAVDAAGCRGLRVGGAKVSEMHCNFLINDQQATGEDVETPRRDRARARQGALGRHARVGDHPPRRAAARPPDRRSAGGGGRHMIDRLRTARRRQRTREHVAVLMGGWSAEREISLQLGRGGRRSAARRRLSRHRRSMSAATSPRGSPS